MVMRQDGSVWSTAINRVREGLRGARFFAEMITSGAKAMAAGFGHSMVLAQDNSLWATGWNLYGQFGDGSLTSSSVFNIVVIIGDSEGHGAVTLSHFWSTSDAPITKVVVKGKNALSYYLSQILSS